MFDLNENTMRIARECGSYQAIAEMMAESIRQLDSDDQFDREWALWRLQSLADQFDNTKAKYAKETV